MYKYFNNLLNIQVKKTKLFSFNCNIDCRKKQLETFAMKDDVARRAE